MAADYNVHYVLELACAAQRINKSYLKENEAVYDVDDKYMFLKFANKGLMLQTVGSGNNDGPDRPADLVITAEDTEMAAAIKKHFRKLAFAIMATPENEFLIEVNVILHSDRMEAKKFGFVACLPSVYKRDFAKTQISKRVKDIDTGFVAAIGASITDQDCDILESSRSKNFDAWNICAIIDNKMVSWFSKTDMQLGPCVIVKAKVKDHSEHWQHKNPVTRLNYVKAAQ